MAGRCAVYPRLSYEKKKAGIFDVPQVWKSVKHENVPLLMTEVEKDDWYAFVKVTQNVLGNKTS